MTTPYEHKTELVGDDYTGLPTRPLRYRGARKLTGLNWDQLTENYQARGGQVDASVWPQVGKVVVIGGNATSSRANLHSFVEADAAEFDYDNDLTQAKPEKQRRTTRLLTDEQCRAISLKYRDELKPIRALADEYGVSVSAIQTALRFTGEATRSRSENNRLRKKAAS